MIYREYIPGDFLKPYVKCYYLYESAADVVTEDKAFATACVELMFNLGSGKWQVSSGGHFVTTPPIELWGQIIQPLSFRSLGNNTMLGIRFFPQAAFIFLNEDVSLFNNQVTDLASVSGKTVTTLHEQLLESASMDKRIGLIENFLLSRLRLTEKKIDKVELLTKVITEMKQETYFDNMDNLARQYGITSRYLQKIFLQYTGLTPKLYSKINRFQNSLQLIAANRHSLTDITYECGYFDQSHFIREFKSFTGITPSGFDTATSSAILASANK